MYELRNKIVMVAGGAGFIGSALIRELLAYGVRVVSYDNYLHGRPSNLEGLTGPLTIVQGDVSDRPQLIQTLETYNVDYIINCIGDPFVPTAYKKPQRSFDVNLYSTLALLMAAKSCCVKRILHVSSWEVYGANASPKLSEEMPLNPLNTYAVSKLAADRLCFTSYLEHGLPIVIARPFNCYGPRETHPYIVPEIITQLNRGNILYLGNPSAERDLTYVHDTARALIAVLESDVPNGEVINIGSDITVSIGELAYMVADIMEVPNLEIKPYEQRFRRSDNDRSRCDNTKLRRYTHWSPQVEIEAGLRRTVSWVRKNGNQWSWGSVYQDET